MSPNTMKNTLKANGQTYDKTDKIERLKENGLPEKTFQIRNSLLIDLFENKHIKTVYHLFIATLIGLFVNTVVHDYVKKREIKLELRLIYLGFDKVHVALLAWLGFFGLSCMCYYAFNVWARLRERIPPKSPYLKIWDRLWVLSVPCYYAFSFRLASTVTTYFQLPPASAAIIAVDQTRLLMKVHAFIRSNAPKVLNHKPHSDNELVLPKLTYFIFFLFVPTLVYRDAYPRTKEIRWKFVACRTLEVVGVIFYLSFVLERLVIPLFQDFGKRKFTWEEIVLSVFETTLTGLLFALSIFFLVLHSWQNLFAELTRFGDRMFYQDWWTSTSYSRFYRTWNIVVQDWLYTYVYKDMYEYVILGNKMAARFAVFILSAVVHEWILTYFFGFFFPLLFVEFFFLGTAFAFINSPRTVVFNVLFLYGFALGAGSLVSMYTLEYYARLNVPLQNETFIDFFIPRIFTCDCIK